MTEKSCIKDRNQRQRNYVGKRVFGDSMVIYHHCFLTTIIQKVRHVAGCHKMKCYQTKNDRQFIKNVAIQIKHFEYY